MNSLLLLGLGLILGFLSGMFGVGGSSLATPLLRLLSLPRLVALASPLPVTLPIALIGGFSYWRHHLVQWRTALWTVAGGVPTVIIGAYLTAIVPGRMLMLLTGLFVAVAGLRVWRQTVANGDDVSLGRAPVWLLALIGVVTGILSGLLANGGGFLLLPAYLLLLHFTPQQAAATSLMVVSALALPETLIQCRLGHIDWQVTLYLALGVLPTTYLGARAGLAMNQQKARRLFGLFLLIFGVLFVVRTLYRAGLYGWLT